MPIRISEKAITALTALKAFKRNAKRKSLDKLAMDEISTEIAAYRAEIRPCEPS